MYGIKRIERNLDHSKPETGVLYFVSGENFLIQGQLEIEYTLVIHGFPSSWYEGWITGVW